MSIEQFAKSTSPLSNDILAGLRATELARRRTRRSLLMAQLVNEVALENEPLTAEEKVIQVKATISLYHQELQMRPKFSYWWRLWRALLGKDPI